MYRTRLVLMAIVALSACSSGGGGGTSAQSAGAASTVRRGGQYLITAEEIEASGAGMQTALDIVQRLRPSMARSRASTFQSGNQANQVPVMVYTDDVPLGTVENLRSIPASQVKEIRYITATDATQRWGTNHSSGVIQVITKR